MFKTGINLNEQNFASDQRPYFAFSSKYKTHYKKLIDPYNKTSLVTFLSGPAGIGKTCTLMAEFLRPLQSTNIFYYHFNFIPDKVVDNHFFLKPIAKHLISVTQDPSFLRELEDFIGHYEQFEKEQPFNASEINKRFIKFLIRFTQFDRLILIFEDVHLAKSNFHDFLLQFERAQNSLALNILCTTRLDKSLHKISSGLNQKWFKLGCMSEKGMEKYLHFLTKRTSGTTLTPINLYSQSGGNPFYVKEFFHFNRQRDGLSQKLENSTPFQSKLNDGKGEIISFRFNSLEKNGQTALKILCLLGYYIDYDEAIQILSEHGVIDVNAVLMNLQNEGFIKKFNNALHFQHHLYYEAIQNVTSSLESHDFHRSIFGLLNRKRSGQNIERLIRHASQAGLKNQTCVLSKKFANILYKSTHYELAAYYYNLYLENVSACSAPQKLGKRTIQVLIPLHSISLILGDHLKEESISNYLLNATNDSDAITRHNIDAALTTSYWTNGHIQKAKQFAKQNIYNALEITDRNLIITAKARYAALCAEVADFRSAIVENDEVFSLITPQGRHEKFGMFVEGLAAATTVHSICHYELGNFDLSKDLAKNAYRIFDESDDNFTRLYISAHAGYTMIMLGEHGWALAYLEQGLATRTKNKATLIAAPALALTGLCHFHIGNIDIGRQKIKESLSLMQSTFKGSKKGIINLAWMESLLVGFRTEEFAENIDKVIDETKDMEQIPHLGWLYFLKAIYHAFFQNSIQGFIGAYTKAVMIAENFDMKALRLNLISLSHLESSGILSAIEDTAFPPGFFDKAEYFYKRTSNVKPISFHIKNRTRS